MNNTITLEAIRAYARFDGDQDGLSRGGTAAEQATADGDLWQRLDQLLMDASNLKDGHLTREYAERVRATIDAEFPHLDVRTEFMRLVDERQSR